MFFGGVISKAGSSAANSLVARKMNTLFTPNRLYKLNRNLNLAYLYELCQNKSKLDLFLFVNFQY
jgi:hypothetical protein